MSTPSIRATVVGSYPVPEWLIALPSQQALIDATKVVFKIQELAARVVPTQLYRWDVNIRSTGMTNTSPPMTHPISITRVRSMDSPAALTFGRCLL